MSRCLKHVYKTMCEYDAKGNRKGKAQGIKYESRPKRGSAPSKATKTTQMKKVDAKEEIRKAYAKRTEERRQKAMSVKAAVKDLLEDYRVVYSDLYNRKVDFSLETIEKADRFIKDRPRLVSMFNELRQDMLMSDREVIAFHRAVMRSRHKNLLYSLDRRM